MCKYSLFLSISLALFYLQVEAFSKNQAKKAFHQLIEATDKTLTQAKEVLNNAVKELQSTSSELNSKAKTELDKILKPLRTKLDDLIVLAKGLDVSKCQKYVDDLTNTPNHLVHNLLDCFNQKLSQAQGYVNSALDNAKNLEQNLAIIDGDIDRCEENENWKNVECYGRLLEKIAEETIKAPFLIMENVGKMVVLIGTLKSSLEACFMLQIVNGGQNATKDVINLAFCAALPFSW